jgi:DNA repair protein RadD
MASLAQTSQPSGWGFFAPEFEPKPLREHQATAIAMLRRSLIAGNRRVVLQLPTGAGKTRTAAELVSGALAKGKRVAFTVPAISLINQTVEAFEAEGIDAIGVMQAGHARTNRAMPVQVVSVQTLARRACPDVDMVIVDECHNQFKQISDWMAEDERRVFVGLSATPWARGMGNDWTDLIVPVTMQELIDAGFLSPFKVFAPSTPDLSGVKVAKTGDYETTPLSEVMSNRTLIADVVQSWKTFGQGLPTLVFAVDRAHARTLQEQFGEAGIRMGYCDAEVDVIERQMLFAQMKRGDIAGIVNIGTLTTGVDADVRCIVLARPTKSEMLFVQMIGRALRTAPGKDHAVILDHADNHHRLGFVTDIHHGRLLKGKEKAHLSLSEKGAATPKACASCKAMKPAGVHVCPACGFKPEHQVKSAAVEVQEGNLVEFKAKVEKHDRAEKQKFWSMANHVDQQRGKGGSLAKALYRGKFGVWPQGLDASPIPPDGAFLSYEHSRRIAFAKSKGKAR